MKRSITETDCSPNTALRHWLELAKNHDVYIELSYEFSGVVGTAKGLSPALWGRLNDWMQNVICRCREEAQENRWLRLKLAQHGNVFRMECEAAGRPLESCELRAAGAHLEVADMEESFFVALEAELTDLSERCLLDGQEERK